MKETAEFTLVAFFIISFSMLCQPVLAASADEPRVVCDAHHESCVAELPGCRVNLDIRPKPVKAMRDLTFILTLRGRKAVFNPYLDLNMPAMDMGRNRVVLKKIGTGIYQGTGVIVRCRSGKRTWMATVTIPGIGRVEYLFDVIY
jgi:hypothetical protein